MIISKIKTALTVILLSGMIWIFAERAVIMSETVMVEIDLTGLKGDTLVQFLDEKSKPVAAKRQTVTLTVEGPTVRIQNIADNYLDVIPFDLSKRKIDLEWGQPKDAWVSIESLLDGKLYSRDEESYVKINDSDPQTLHVRMIKLVPKMIPVVVFDENNVELTPEKIEPKEVEALVADERTRAEVHLKNETQRRQAMQGELIDLEARVVFQNRVDTYPVKLVLPPEASKTLEIHNPLLNINIPQAIAEKYVLILEDITLKDEYGPIKISGNPKAISEYDKMGARGHLILDVLDSDTAKVSVSRPLRYNLPVGMGDIKVVDPKATAIRFRLEKVEIAVKTPVKPPELPFLPSK